MLDAITSQLSPQSRDLADRSIAAAAGALFGIVVCGAAAIVTGRAPFALDLPMVTLYASAIPLSVAGFMVEFSRKKPKLPMLATLWFLALFVPMMFFSEVFSAGSELHLGGLVMPSGGFVGFRAIVVAALSGLLFSGINAEGLKGEATRDIKPSVDWQKRHDEAIQRLALVDVDLRHQRAREEHALAAFDRELGELAAAEWELSLDAKAEDVEAVSEEVELAVA